MVYRLGAFQMSHTLVTFLGRSRESKDTGYRKTVYQFPDGATDETAFFGLALSRHLKPDAIVILGTHSSQWDVLVENLAEEGEVLPDEVAAEVWRRVQSDWPEVEVGEWMPRGDVR